MSEELNPVKLMIDTVRDTWIRRKGNEIHASVVDVINALYKEDLRPLIIKKTKSESKLTFVIHLPPGIAYSQFLQKKEYFQDASGGAVQITKKGKAVIMEISTENLKGKYPYSWNAAAYKKMYLPVPFGYSAGGLVVKDLAEMPNCLIAGHPGSGKSNLLHIIALSLLENRDIYLIIIDLKKLEFAYMQDAALIVSEIADAQKVLGMINKELDKRLNILMRAGVVKIQDYSGKMPFILLMIDELAELQDDICQEYLNRLVRLGRAPGINVVASTQRPSSTMFNKFGDIKAQFAASVCFHVRDELNSRMVLGNDKAALMPNIPGRAIFQWDLETEIQSMFLPVAQAKKLIPANAKVVKIIEPEPVKRLPPR